MKNSLALRLINDAINAYMSDRRLMGGEVPEDRIEEFAQLVIAMKTIREALK